MSGIFLLLNKGTAGLSLLSLAIAAPLAGIFMQKWVEDFACRIPITADIFPLAGVLSLFTVSLAVCYHSLRAAQSNPSDILRQE